MVSSCVRDMKRRHEALSVVQVNYEPANQQPYIQAAPVSAASFTPVSIARGGGEGRQREECLGLC